MARSDGIGAYSGEIVRSERTIAVTPRSRASLACRQSRSTARSSSPIRAKHHRQRQRAQIAALVVEDT
jgi:hypothetical protein